MATAYINIGSNVGDRHGNIARAVAAVERAFGTRLRLSDPIESPPWGYDSALPYINLGAAFTTALPPLEILDRLLQCQQAIDPAPHRAPDGSYLDRRIDIDLIALDEMVYDHPRLTLPHPRMHLRPFVWRPLLQLCPSWRHPRGLSYEL